MLAPHEAVLLGTAALLAESLKGVRHSMHSRSAVLLQLLLDDGVLTRVASVLRPTPSTTKSRSGPVNLRRSRRTTHAGGGSVAPGVDADDGNDADLEDVAHGRVRAVATVTLDRVWEHLRRGGCADAWVAIQGDATRALDALHGVWGVLFVCVEWGVCRCFGTCMVGRGAV